MSTCEAARARTVDKVISSLKLGIGKYLELYATAADESKVLLSIFKDENDKERTQRRMGAIAKKAIAAI